MRYALLLLLLPVLAGCPQPMTNEAMGAAVRECQKEGLAAKPIQHGDGQVYGVQCVPPGSFIWPL